MYKKKKYKIFFYTVLIGNYDFISKPDEKILKNFDIYFVTDIKKKYPNVYKKIEVKKKFFSNFLTSRYYKIFPYNINEFKNFDYSVYFDANIKIKEPILELLYKFIKSRCDLGLIKHPQRKNVNEEAKLNIRLKKVSKNTVDEHNKYYKKHNYISKNDLTENNLIFRKHKNLNVKKTMKIWWNLTKKFNVRDQHTLPFARFRSKSKTLIFNLNLRLENKYIDIYPHSGNKQISRLKFLLLKLSKRIILFQFFISFYLFLKNFKKMLKFNF